MGKVKNIPNILSIAGSDPSGGAGMQADLKAITALGGYGMAVITALTAQNTQGVQGVEYVSAGFVGAQIQSIFDDIQVDAVKIGMAGSADSVRVIAEVLKKQKDKKSNLRIILDPVMVATSGDSLSSDESVRAIIDHLVPLADIVTPNIPEAEVLGCQEFQGNMGEISRAVLAQTGARAVYLKGGHSDATCDSIEDVYVDEVRTYVFSSPRIKTKNTHGTGCTLSSAMATCLTMESDFKFALERARGYLQAALENASFLNVGQGCGPLYHGKTICVK